MSFLQKVAQKIAENHPNTADYRIVLPSKRAKRYLMEALAIAYGKPIFSPEIFTIDEFIRKHTQHPILDSTRQLFILYNITRQTEKYEGLGFEDFLQWGSMVLGDYDEMNRYLLDTQQVFKNLISIKELESWNLGEGMSLSKEQKKFMEFWDSLPELFTAFKAYLDENEKTTMGLAIKDLATHFDQKFNDDKPHFFVGFNALTLAECTLIKKMLKRNQATFLTDADAYYLENVKHEAGYFIRKNQDFLELPSTEFVSHELTSKPLNIEVIECTQTTGQVKVVGTELSKLSPEELSCTLVLLADESLVVALMKNIPESVQSANITIGLPLKQTPMKSFVDLIFSIQENKTRFNSKAAYFRDLIALTHHSFITTWLGDQAAKELENWEYNTIQKNRIFHNVSTLPFPAELNKLLSLLYEDWKEDYLKAIQTIKAIVEELLGFLGKDFDFEKQTLLCFKEAILVFEVLATEGLPTMNLKTFKQFLSQQWAKKSIAFHGNPTKGLQIMGLLETRLLDFERIFVLGMNEGNLPATNPIDSIIPMDLRYGLGLPTMREKQGLFAHHFYRLLHVAKQVTITYSTASDILKSSEPSRYLMQLEMELQRVNPLVKIHKKFYATAFPDASELHSLEVEKESLILHQLNRYFSRNISSSALSKYLACPLDFYYRYIAEFGEEDTVEEELESQNMGKIIHDTLEQLYLPFAERTKTGEEVQPPPGPLSVNAVEEMVVKYPEIVKNEFLKFLNGDEKLMESGKNWLTFSVAKEVILNALKNDITYIKNNAEPVFIFQVEAVLKAKMNLNVSGQTKEISWVGHIDRIDRVGNAYRIVDYKTGVVKNTDVNFNRSEDLLQSFQKTKHALQLAVYAYLFNENYGIMPKEIGIYALLMKQNAFNPLTLKNRSLSEFQNDFSDLIEKVVNEIYNLDAPFIHNPKAKYCPYC